MMETLRIDQNWLTAASRGFVASVATDEGTVMRVIVEELEDEDDFDPEDDEDAWAVVEDGELVTSWYCPRCQHIETTMVFDHECKP